MEAEADKLHRDLQRYRRLVGRTTDPQFKNAIKKLIAEAEVQLHAIERGTGS